MAGACKGSIERDGQPGATQNAADEPWDLLLRHRAIDADQLAQAEEEQTKWGGDLGRILVDLGFINEELLVRALAQQLGIPALNPAARPLLPELVRALPVQICERFGVIGVQVDEATRRLRVATSDPGNAAHLTQIGELSGWHVEAAAATAASIELAIRRNYYGEPARGPLQGSVTRRGARGIPPPEREADEVAQPEAALPDPALPGAAEEEASSSAGAHQSAEHAHAEPPPPEPLPRELPRRHSGPMTELDAITARVEQLERMLSNPQFAAIMARLERLEQLAETEGKALRIIGAVLVEQGLITREEFVRRMKS